MQRIKVSPTLVVGVGGTGCTVAKRLKRIVFDEVDPEDRDKVAFSFIGIDTDGDQMPPKADIGEEPLDYAMSIHGKAQVFDIGDRSPEAQSFLRWLPRDRQGELVIDPASLASGKGAGGKRALGRYAFKYFAPQFFQNVKRHVESLVYLDRNPIVEWKGIEYDRSAGLQVIVVSSFAGGTGSGGFMDAIAMCHHLCDQIALTRPVTVRGVFVLPSAFEYVAHPQNRQLQAATAYSCLKDLEFVMGQKSGTVSFDFHSGNDVTINRPFLDEAYLIDRMGSSGVISTAEQLMHLIATTLYGMVGTPMGMTHGSRLNNAGSYATKSAEGGTRRYSTFGLVGIDYDIKRLTERAASGLGAQALNRFLYGASGQPLSDDQARSLADSLVRPFADGPLCFFIKDLYASHLSDVQLNRADEALRQEKPRAFSNEMREHSEGVRADIVGREIEKDATAEWSPTSQALPESAFGKLSALIADCVAAEGIANAEKVLGFALAKAKASVEQLADPQLEVSRKPTDIADEARSPLDKMNFFYVLSKRDEVDEKMTNAKSAYNNGLESMLRGYAVKAAKATAFSEMGLVRYLTEYASKAREARLVLEDARQQLEEDACANSAPALKRSSLDLSGVIFDAPLPPGCLPKFEEGDVDELLRRLVPPGTGSALSFTQKSIADALKSEVASSQKMVEDVRQAGVELVKDSGLPHILRVIDKQPGDEEDRMKRILDQAFQNISAMLPVDTSRISSRAYDFALALLPLDNGNPHPSQQKFSDMFEEVCTERSISQPSVETWPGDKNRLFINHWLMGLALNDEEFPSLAPLRQAYQQLVKESPFLEVDRTWMYATGPGSQTRLGRDEVWTLGLAYGLIAADHETQFYNNLKTTQVKDYQGKTAYDQYEVDLETIAGVTEELAQVEGWFDKICVGTSDQTVVHQRIPLAYELGGIPALTRKAKREKRDLIGVGRAAALSAFKTDANEDYQDVEEGITHVINRYVLARGVGTFAGELAKYRDALEAQHPSEDMREQIQLEVSVINAILDRIKEANAYKLGG